MDASIEEQTLTHDRLNLSFHHYYLIACSPEFDETLTRVMLGDLSQYDFVNEHPHTINAYTAYLSQCYYPHVMLLPAGNGRLHILHSVFHDRAGEYNGETFAGWSNNDLTGDVDCFVKTCHEMISLDTPGVNLRHSDWYLPSRQMFKNVYSAEEFKALHGDADCKGSRDFAQRTCNEIFMHVHFFTRDDFEKTMYAEDIAMIIIEDCRESTYGAHWDSVYRLLSYLWMVTKGYGNPIPIYRRCFLSTSDGEPDYSNHIEYISRQLNTYLQLLYRTMMFEKGFDNATVLNQQTLIFQKFGAGYENGGFNIPFDFSTMTICASTEEHKKRIIAILQPQVYNNDQLSLLFRDLSEDVFVFPFNKFNIIVGENYPAEGGNNHDDQGNANEECKANGGKAPRIQLSK